MPREMHPRFSARFRRYAYLLPLNQNQSVSCMNDVSESDARRVDAALQHLVNRPLPYRAMAFGPLETENDMCTLFEASSRIVDLPLDQEDGVSTRNVTSSKALVVHLVGDRFLRRMVRILVATVVRQVITTRASEDLDTVAGDAAGAEIQGVLLAGDRSASAHPAPSNGLAFLGAGYYDVHMPEKTAPSEEAKENEDCPRWSPREASLEQQDDKVWVEMDCPCSDFGS